MLGLRPAQVTEQIVIGGGFSEHRGEFSHISIVLVSNILCDPERIPLGIQDIANLTTPSPRRLLIDRHFPSSSFGSAPLYSHFEHRLGFCQQRHREERSDVAIRSYRVQPFAFCREGAKWAI